MTLLGEARPQPLDEIARLRERYTAVRAENSQLKAECAAYQAQLEGRIPDATHWLQSKVWRQRLALDTLTRRVSGQRFVLRTLESLGRGLSRDEYLAAREELQNAQLRERIPEQPEEA